MSSSSHAYILNPAGDLMLGNRIKKATTSVNLCKELEAKLERTSNRLKAKRKAFKDLEYRRYNLLFASSEYNNEYNDIVEKITAIRYHSKVLYDRKQDLKKQLKNAKCVRKSAFSRLWSLFA